MKDTRQVGFIPDLTQMHLLAKYASSGRHTVGPQNMVLFWLSNIQIADVQICLLFHGAAALSPIIRLNCSYKTRFVKVCVSLTNFLPGANNRLQTRKKTYKVSFIFGHNDIQHKRACH